MKKFKSLLGAVLALAILCGFPGFGSVSADNTPSFTDVKPGDAHYETIKTWSAEYAKAFAEGNPSTFGDDDAFAGRCRTFIAYSCNWDMTKFLVGSDFAFKPYKPVTRGEVCQALYNAGVVGLNPLGAAPYCG